MPPPQLLLLGSIASVQFGSAFADKLFAQAGPGGVVLLRLALSAIMLLAISRPSLRGRPRADLGAAIAFGLKAYGSNVGLMDADVYGPSLPMMFGITGRPRVGGVRLQRFVKVGGTAEQMHRSRDSEVGIRAEEIDAGLG